MQSPTPRRNSFSSRMGRTLLAPSGFTRGSGCTCAAAAAPGECRAEPAAAATASLLPGPLLWLLLAAAEMGLQGENRWCSGCAHPHYCCRARRAARRAAAGPRGLGQRQAASFALMMLTNHAGCAARAP